MYKIFALIAFCVFLTGCYTVFKGRYQEVTINSNVGGALVEVDGVEVGYTPLRAKVKKNRRGEGNIKISKPGYVAGEIKMERKKHSGASTGGNAVLGAIVAAPIYSTLAPMEHADYLDKKEVYKEELKQYEKEKEEYDNRISSGITEAPPSRPMEPTDNFYSVLASGTTVNLAVMGLGMSIDGLTGATWEYAPAQYYVQLYEEGQSSVDFQNETAIRYFATVNHSQIAIDASVGETGEYTNALINLMSTKTDGEIAKQSINEALEKSKGDQVLFGDELIARFRR